MFLTYLRSSFLHIDILCIQEVSSYYTQDHLTADQCHYFRSFLFPNRSVVFSKHCAIICLNPSLSIDCSTISFDERCVAAMICDDSGNHICPIVNVYGPAQSSERMSFLQSFMSLPFLDLITGNNFGFLLGDFNLNISHLASTCTDSRFQDWYEWLTTHFNNCFLNGKPTFQRGSSRSVIDYIFCHTNIASLVSNCIQYYLPSNWTDHQLLCIDLRSPREDVGPGCWRFNTTFLDNDNFLSLLDEMVLSFMSTVSQQRVSKSSQQFWESFKLAIKEVGEFFSRGYKKRFNKRLNKLQDDLQKAVLPTADRTEASDNLAKEIELMLDTSIRKESEQLYLRSATRWHEEGERNNKYFYRVIKSRQKQQTIQAVKSSVTGEVVTSTDKILLEARQFYENLYTPEEIDNVAIDQLLDNIPVEAKLNLDQVNALDKNPAIEELMSIINHSPIGKSPGLDGIPFEVYKYLFRKFTSVSALFLKVLQEAFEGVIPFSWKQTRMVLLYKKGDPTLLSNWRPLSLINSDAKLYTKLLANRFNRVLPKLINPYQTGFMPNRLISDNGFVNISLMANYQESLNTEADTAVAVLLDQEKAYDRVHPEYLSRVLLHFGFSQSMVTSLQNLFFGTSISVSINGFLSSPLSQGRGLRQGDPLSPLLFNIAFEPLLRTIIACSRLTGVKMQDVITPKSKTAKPASYRDHSTGIMDSPVTTLNPPSFKLLSYADDLEVFLSSSSEWPILQDLLQVYGAASNARVNINKTEIVSLSGRISSDWVTITDQQHISYHTAQSTTAVRYLGYPLYSTSSQLLSFLMPIKQKIQRHCNILGARGLSARGSSLIANSIILSTVWHVLRVVTVPASWINEIRAVVKKFVVSFWPSPSWKKICLPKTQGGLSVVDIHLQQHALKLIFIQRLLKPKSRTDFVSPLIGHSIYLYSGHCSFLPWLQYPSVYLTLFRKIPAIHSLTQVLIKLPFLPVNIQWSGRWLADTPLKFAIQPTASHMGINTLIIEKIPLRHLVSDVVAWSPYYGCFINFLYSNLPRRGKPTQVHGMLQKVDPPIQWKSSIARFIPVDSSIDAVDQFSSVTNENILIDRWVPECSHWVLDIKEGKPQLVAKISSGKLRRYWQHQDMVKQEAQSHRQFNGLIRIPFSVTTSYLPPNIWKYFWSLELPHKVFNPWWRMLNNCIFLQATMFKWNPQKWPSSLCQICRSNSEDMKHFFITCYHKWSFWQAAILHLSLSEKLNSQEAIWSALISLHDVKNNMISEDILLSIGNILEILWKYHWLCIQTSAPWSTTAAISMLSSSISVHFPAAQVSNTSPAE